jgi:hypothetical protein
MYGQSEFPSPVFNVDPAQTEHAETAQRAGVVLPALAELQSHMSQLVQRHGAVAVVAELLKVVPARQLRAACDAAWGVNHDDPDEQACLIAIGEAAPVVTPQTAHGRTVGILDRHSPISAAVPYGAHGIIYRQCWHCEPGYGRQDQQCDATALLELDEMKAELAALKLGVDAREAEEGVVSAEARKAARYCMYRKYVGEQWGVVGRGKRIRLPPCVVEAIRDSFREPGCLCAVGEGGGPLFSCTSHGYTGHRDAPESE